jgi:hypothetical protein
VKQQPKYKKEREIEKKNNKKKRKEKRKRKRKRKKKKEIPPAFYYLSIPFEERGRQEEYVVSPLPTLTTYLHPFTHKKQNKTKQKHSSFLDKQVTSNNTNYNTNANKSWLNSWLMESGMRGPQNLPNKTQATVLIASTFSHICVCDM